MSLLFSVSLFDCAEGLRFLETFLSILNVMENHNRASKQDLVSYSQLIIRDQ